MSDVPLRPKRKIRTCEEEGGKTTEAWSTIVMRWLVCVCVCVCVCQIYELLFVLQLHSSHAITVAYRLLLSQIAR